MNMFHNANFCMYIVNILKDNDARCAIDNVEKAITLVQEYRRNISVV